jgi:iron complex outermembrane recepter protein
MKQSKIFATAAALLGSLASALAATAVQGQEAPAPNASDTSATLEEIIVTAQRRSEKSQDVPIAMSVVSGDEIAAAGIQHVTDLAYVAPGVQYNPANGSGFQIRGVGTQVYDYSTEQAIGVVVDDVVMDMPRNPGFNGLGDIDHVEILRGPQGTLFGKNSSGGVISVTTKRPDLTTESGDASVSYGLRDDFSAQMNFNVPLSDITALRVSAFTQGQEGFGRYTVLDERLGNYTEEGARAKFLIKPDDTFDVMLIADYTHHYDNNAALAGALLSSPTLVAESTLYGAPPGPNNYNNADSHESTTTYDVGGVSGTVNYRFSNYTLTSVTAFRAINSNGVAPLDFVPTYNFITDNHGVIVAKKVSEELRLSSPGGQFFDYVLGLYYNKYFNDATQTQAGTLTVPGLPPGTFLSTTDGQAEFHNDIKNKAVFGQGTLNFTDSLKLALGGRYTDDNNGAQFQYNPHFVTYYTYIPAAGVPTPPTDSVSKSNFSYRIAPEFKLTQDIMLFADYATGYKGPGIAYLSGLAQPYKSETVKSYEVGVKSEWMEHRLRVNVTAYHEKFTNFQAQNIEFVNGGPVFLIVNAGGLESKGVETEFAFQATQRLSFTTGAAYSATRFTDYILEGVQLAGEPLTNAPKWSGTAGTNWLQPIGNGYQVITGLNYAYRSSALSTAGDLTSVLHPYGLLNLRSDFGPEGGKWTVGVYARNLLNKFYAVSINDYPNGQSQSFTNDSQRTVGVQASVKF